jgi:Ca-activated chloride channel homolog
MSQTHSSDGGSRTPGAPPRDAAGGAATEVSLAVRPERRLIRPSGSFRHVDFCVRVAERPAGVAGERPALHLALVLDRSGSMSGAKLETAKRATLAVLDRLDARDRVAVVTFDDRIDVLQAAAPATAELRSRVREALGAVQARASTALHEGWLTGCHAIADDRPAPTEQMGRTGAAAVTRCFLLTDGLANVGLTDPEQIATEAAGIREHAGVGTSTFGIGDDYDEALLAPLATAGGGQFHHLRTPEEIARTFVGELGELLAVAAGRVRLELEADPGVTAEVVSAYWTRGDPEQGGAPSGRWSVAVGDLLAGEERHLVVRFAFPSGGPDGAARRVRARVCWTDGGIERATPWHELAFTYADHAACDAEARDAAVMHWVGLDHADRARREATDRSKRGDLAGARDALRRVARRLSEYAGGDHDLEAALSGLREYERDVADRPVASAVAKESFFQTHRRSRGQRDHRA